MLFVSILTVSLLLLFVFSMSKEKGKNTKFARKGANAIAPKQKTRPPVNTSGVIEVN